MNLGQLKLLLPLLRLYADHLSAMSCNDWHLPNTAEGKALWTAINQWSDPDDAGEWTFDDMSKPTLFMPDFTAIEYLIHCIDNDLVRDGKS